MEIEDDFPYAELWVGAHPKLQSKVILDNSKIDLSDFITQYPYEILGEKVENKFGPKLPFLFKVLSINEALSIQAHPNKQLAEILHSKDPKNYPDDNHKPEIAIAIDNLKALVGLKKFEEIVEIFNKYDELKKIVSEKTLSIFLNDENDREEKVKLLYAEILSSDEIIVEKVISELVKRFSESTNLNENEKEFLTQYETYGNDIGLISILLFNIVKLNSGEAIFTGAGIPHAYLKGNIIECMANSDNVVRAGLTPKYKDVKTLAEMINVNSEETNVTVIEKGIVTKYQTPADEFEVNTLELNNENSYTKFDSLGFSIFLILDGKIEVNSSDGKEVYEKGETFLIPSDLTEFSVSKLEDSKIYFVTIPV